MDHHSRHSLAAGTLLDRLQGAARTGTVSVRDFDRGIVTTLGGFVADGPDKTPSFWLLIDGVRYEPGYPGIPIIFSRPEEVFKTYQVPVIMIRRDQIIPAMNRWEPGTLQYRTAALQGTLTGLYDPSGNKTLGFNRYEQLLQACPFDIMYTVAIQGRDRKARFAADTIMNHVIRTYPPYGHGVIVHDSIGDRRSYEVFNRNIQNADEAVGIDSRVIGFVVSLDVQAELDLTDPYTRSAVTSNVVTVSQLPS